MKQEDVIPIYDTHNLYSDGGRKIHVLNNKTDKCLCGYYPNCYDIVPLDGRPYNNIIDFINQADPARNICQRCKKILIGKLNLAQK